MSTQCDRPYENYTVFGPFTGLAIKQTVQQLVDVPIDTLPKPSPLTSSELDEYRSRSERISALYQQLDVIVRKRFHARSQAAA